jgi:hypothetical protein
MTWRSGQPFSSTGVVPAKGKVAMGGRDRKKEAEMRLLAIAPFSLMLAFAAPAVAQTDQQNNSPAAPADKCRVETEQGAKQQPGQQPDGGNLTETLNDCGGVLKPPPTGDQGMAAPAPDQGKTPVIKPGEVPAQPPKQ